MSTAAGIDLFKYLTSVYQSDVNQSLYNQAFSRFLTQDDSIHVYGYVGIPNSQQSVNRQIVETTPERQAYQLAPTMITKLGAETFTLSYDTFLERLTLMGVQSDRQQLWGNTLQFNWVPPVNIDMLANYTNYFWYSPTTQTDPQYFTIENTCDKLTSKVKIYENVLTLRGSTFPVVSIDVLTNSFVINGKQDDLFVAGFTIYTTNTTNTNLSNKFWTVQTSSYDINTDLTAIEIQQPIAVSSSSAPPSATIGEWWLNSETNSVYVWTGTDWTPTTAVASVSIDLTQLLSIYKQQASCACLGDNGWDESPWDDNSASSTNWNAQLVAASSAASSAAWEASNGVPTIGSLWYNTTTDQLLAYTSNGWTVSYSNFSVALAATTNTAAWDSNTGCTTPSPNQWASENNWIHRSQVQSFANVQRAQLPIIEYSSSVEANQWVKQTYRWYYRTGIGNAFEETTAVPSRIELEPIKGFVAVNVAGAWTIFLFDQSDITTTRDLNLTSVFQPGYQFSIVDDYDLGSQTTYTVQVSECRELTPLDPVQAVQAAGQSTLVTIVTIKDVIFNSPTVGGGPTHVRIVPNRTSVGDVFKGYHLHWYADVTSTASSPAAPVPMNPYLSLSINSRIAPVAASQGLQSTGLVHQDLIVTESGQTQFILDPSLQWSATSPNHFSLANQNAIRVYVNGVRQYGNYTELTASATVDYTLIGDTVYPNLNSFEYVTGIDMAYPVSLFDVVRIEVGVASLADVGMGCVPVRTVADDTEFAQEVAAGNQPLYLSIDQYKLTEQSKTLTNQYPLFNVYDTTSGDIVDANPLFQFTESGTSAIDPNTNRRIVTVNGTDYSFTNLLVGNNQIYAYRDLNLATALGSTARTPMTSVWWYNPQTNLLKCWDGSSWSSTAVVATSTGLTVQDQNRTLKAIVNVGTSTPGFALRVPVVSVAQPTALQILSQPLWYNPNTNVLQSYGSGMWANTGVTVIVGSDPTLRTIWRHGTNNEQYVPQYVNSSRTPVAIGSSSGGWQIPDQWFFNAEHQNASSVMYSQLVSHFGSISAAQPSVPGLLAAGTGVLTQAEYDYGLGGTIKEHNDGYDLLVSATNVDTVTPPQVIEFACEEYANGLRNVLNIFIRTVLANFTAISVDALFDLPLYVSNQVIAAFQADEYSNRIYSDSSAYESSTGSGMKNFIATLPVLGFVPRIAPYINELSSAFEIVHHDGHRSTEGLAPSQIDQLATVIVQSLDSRTGKNLGVISATGPVTTAAALSAALNIPEVVTGAFWYDSTSRVLYRFAPVFVSADAPSSNGLSDGAIFYSTYTKAGYRLVNGTWTLISTLGSGDISSLWTVVDINAIYLNTLLSVETNLYNVASSGSIDLKAVQTAEPTVYNSYMEQRFFAYADLVSVISPLSNLNYVSADPFSWNYATSNVSYPPTSSTATAASCWQALYTNWYNTPYPHREPWKLQGYQTKPLWWDTAYRDTSGVRVWIYDDTRQVGMWANIMQGEIPAGYPYPNGNISTGNAATDGQTLPTYRYVSVNISNNTIAGYAPDDLLPPYFDITATSATYPRVRSLFFSYSAEIVAPQSDYVFGLGGPTEWSWSTSIYFLYDQMIVNFLMQPVRFFHQTFGNPYTEVDSLQIDIQSQSVINHANTLFHGSLVNNQPYEVLGVNQWYVDYVRSTSQDASRQFDTRWRDWTPTMTYRFGTIVDSSTVQISNRNFDLTDKDYSIILSADGVIQQLDSVGFLMSILATAPAITYRNNQDKWKIQIDSIGVKSRTITYYDIQQYPFVVDLTSNTIKTQTYQIIGASAVENRFYVAGDRTEIFAPGTSFVVSGTPSNNGTYTTASSYYDIGSGQTRVSVSQSVALSAAIGTIQCSTRTVSFATGDMVTFSGSGNIPAQLIADTPYFIISVGTNTYQVAETYQNAITGVPITFTVAGSGEMYVGKVDTTFKVLGGSSINTDLWYHYAVDLTAQYTATLPITVYGLQSVVNVIDGYQLFQTQSGFGYGVSSAATIDPVTGRTVDWQLETERFLDWAYAIRQTNVVITDKYQVSADLAANGLDFVDMVPSWADNTRIYISSTGTMPGGVLSGISYYARFISGTSTIQLYTTLDTTGTTPPVMITSAGSGTITASLPAATTVGFPTFEVNPQRDVVWINTATGVLADVINGPGREFGLSELVYDQYGRPMGADKFTVYRQDDYAKLVVQPNITNDVVQSAIVDPYNYIHFGGGTFFLLGYEHYLTFSNYTVGGDLIYDPFLGIQAQRFTLDFYRQRTSTLQPVMNGFFLTGDQMARNILGTITDLQYAYDVVNAHENSPLTTYARQLVGYDQALPYLNLLNVNDKAQFNFYRGMIKQKGSNNSIIAYTNSRRFIDAQMDEYWAVKLGDFGSAAPKYYPEINLFSSDSLTNDLRLMFLDTNQSTTDSVLSSYFTQDGFNAVSFADPTRWRNFPQQRDAIQSPLFLDGEFTSRIVVATTTIAPTELQTIDHGIEFWFDPTTGNTWNCVGTGPTFAWTTAADARIRAINGFVYVDLLTSTDGVVVIKRSFDSTNDFSNFMPTYYPEGVALGNVHRVNSRVVRFNAADATSGVFVIYTVAPSDDKISPISLVDVGAGVVMDTMSLWDPARGLHYAPAIRNVSIIASNDPALYSTPVNSTAVASNFWGAAETGKVWLDSSVLSYIPYYDDQIFPDVSNRLLQWGQLAPWASVNVYQWVQSTTPPQQWDATVAAQANNTLIPQSSKLSGTAKASMYFRQRLPYAGVTTQLNPLTNLYDVISPVAVPVNTVVIPYSSSTLPTGLTVAAQYVVSSSSSVSNGYSLILTDVLTGTTPTITSSGTFELVPTFTSAVWTRHDVFYERHIAAMELSGFPVTTASISLASSDWVSSIDSADVYVNGTLVASGVMVANGAITITNVLINEQDLIDIVRTQHTLTVAESSFDPSVYDDGSILIQWSQLYDYSMSTVTYGSSTTSTTTATYYYFWVQNTTSIPAGVSTQQFPLMSVAQISSTLQAVSVPYVVAQLPQLSNQLLAQFGYDSGPYGATFDSAIAYEQFYESPVFYRQAIVRGISNQIDADNQYILRFTRDLTLRTRLRDDLTGQLKQSKHEKWMLIRRNQSAAVPQFLWTILIQSLAGFNLTSGAPVPALERVLYDDVNSTATQYGLEINQTMVDKQVGLSTVLAYLENTTNDFSPINIDEFLTSNDFTTPTGIATALQAIYETFPTNHVNAIWFEVLMDGLTMQPNMRGLFKSSWVALHGVRILSVGGMFDD